MKKNTQILLILLSSVALLAQGASPPTWQASPLMNSGEHKSINNGTATSPSTFTYSQPFNTAFVNAPRVLLSLQGYKQDAPSNSQNVGFKVEITSVTPSIFHEDVTVYGTTISLLYYMYMGVDYDATDYYVNFQSLSFSSGNLADQTSASRQYFQVRSNGAGQTFSTFGTNSIIMQGYLSGYRMNMGTAGTYITMSTDPLNSTHYNLSISTKHDAEIYEISYFRLSFDLTKIQSTYVSFIDIGTVYGANSVEVVQPSNLTADNFQYRNYLMGFVNIQIADPSLQRDFLLAFVGTPQIIYSSTYSTPTYQYLQALIFHHRVRVCSAGEPHYFPNDEQCYAQCPQSYYSDSNGSYCAACHSSCLTCSGPLSTECETCHNYSNIVLSNGSCVCDVGYYEDNTNNCSLCDSTCLTCSSSSSSCTSCNSTLNRQLSGSSCPCIDQYAESSGQCVFVGVVCGDGHVSGSQGCDDHNTVSGDGCSSSCSIESSHSCQQRNNGTSLCYYSETVGLKIQSIEKVQYDNQINIAMEIDAPGANSQYFKEYLENLQAISISDGRRRVLASQVLRVISASYTASSGLLQLVLEYSASIASLSSKTFSFVSSADTSTTYNTYFFATPSTTINLEEPHNNIPIIFYSSDEYSSVQSLSGLYLAIVIMSLLFLLGTVIFRKTVYAVECMVVLQIGFMFLLGQENVEVGFAGFGVVGKYLMGYNVNLMADAQTCFGMQALSLECNSIDNMNITAYIAIICLLVCVGLQIYKHRKQLEIDAKSSSSSSESERPTNKESSAPTIQPIQKYKFRPQIQTMYSVMHQLSTALFVLVWMCYWATVCYQNSLNLVGSIVWDILLGFGFVGMCVLWFLIYRSREFSYWDIVREGIEKLSINKFYYLIIFFYLAVLSILLSLVTGYVGYSLSIVFSIGMIVLVLRKQIYRKSLNQIRSIINYAIIIIISLIFIIVDAVDVGSGVGASISLGFFLLVCVLVNLCIWVYMEYYEYKNYERQKTIKEESEHSKELQQKQQMIDNIKNTPMKTEKKVPLLEQGMKTVIRDKISQLKAFKEELKMDKLNKTDEQMAKENLTLYAMSKLNTKIEQQI